MDIARREYPGEVFFVEGHGNRGNESAQVIQQKIVAEGQMPVDDAEAASVVGEVLEAPLREVVKTVESQMNQVGRVRVGVHATVMGRDDGNLRPELGHAVNFRHGPQRVRLVFDEVGEINLVRTGVAERPRKARQLAQDVSIRTGLAVQSNRSGDLLFLSTANIENQNQDVL